jgi:hypothetical protein
VLLQSIDLNLLDVADHEGIEVEDILHVVHDNHPHVPHVSPILQPPLLAPPYNESMSLVV